MPKIMMGVDKISADKFFNRTDTDRIRDQIGRVKKRSIRMVVRQSFTQRVIKTWNSLPAKVVTAKTVDSFKIELDRYP